MHILTVLSYPTYMTLTSVHIPPVLSLLIADRDLLNTIKTKRENIISRFKCF